MASFKKVHEMPCLCLIEEIIVEEVFALLYEAYKPSNLPFPHSAYKKFSLAKLPETKWRERHCLCFDFVP